MPVKDADPGAQELTEAFAAAMSGPARPREAAAPPEIDPDAPHGRDEAGAPLAPFGLTKDGKPRRNNAGRKAKEDAPRTTSAPPADETKKPKDTDTPPPVADFSEPLGELHDAIWLGISGLSMIGPRIPVVGKKLDGQKIAAEGYIWRQNRAHLIKAAQITADHNDAARARLARLAAGNSTWVLMAGFTLMPFVAQTAAVLAGDTALQEMNPGASVKRLADLNRDEWNEAMEDMRAQAVAMAAEAGFDTAASAPEANGQTVYASA